MALFKMMIEKTTNVAIIVKVIGMIYLLVMRSENSITLTRTTMKEEHNAMILSTKTEETDSEGLELYLARL